jgi:hypothetical protein
VLGASTTEERGGCDRGNIAKQNARGTTGHRVDVTRKTIQEKKPRKYAMLFEDEQLLEGGDVTCYPTVISAQRLQ